MPSRSAAPSITSSRPSKSRSARPPSASGAGTGGLVRASSRWRNCLLTRDGRQGVALPGRAQGRGAARFGGSQHGHGVSDTRPAMGVRGASCRTAAVEFGVRTRLLRWPDPASPRTSRHRLRGRRAPGHHRGQEWRAVRRAPSSSTTRRSASGHFVFLDNGSTDDTVEQLCAWEHVTVLQTDAPDQKYENTMKRYPGGTYSRRQLEPVRDIDELFDYPWSADLPLSPLPRVPGDARVHGRRDTDARHVLRAPSPRSTPREAIACRRNTLTTTSSAISKSVYQWSAALRREDQDAPWRHPPHRLRHEQRPDQSGAGEDGRPCETLRRLAPGRRRHCRGRLGRPPALPVRELFRREGRERQRAPAAMAAPRPASTSPSTLPPSSGIRSCRSCAQRPCASRASSRSSRKDSWWSRTDTASGCARNHGAWRTHRDTAPRPEH